MIAKIPGDRLGVCLYIRWRERVHTHSIRLHHTVYTQSIQRL
jgi:hypothetical protein